MVGAGPTGLTIANLLGRHGVRTLLVERNATTVQAPRAVSIDDESLRTMQAIGIVDEVRSECVGGYGSIYLTPAGQPFLTVEPTAEPYGYPRRNAFRQPVLEGQLRQHLALFDTVDTMFGWGLSALEQGPDSVRLEMSGTDGLARTVEASFVVAADGASSFVRSQLGLELEGETFEERWLIVDLEQSPAPDKHTIVFCDSRRPCIALPGPRATRRFEFKLLPGDDENTIVTDDRVWSLLLAHGAAEGSIIIRRAIYTFHARLAPTWSSGRVFLAGDACHLTPPFAGQGMNSGVRDAHNLAWKLALTCRGVLPDTVLSTYEEERREHVGEMISLAMRMGRIMGPRSPMRGWLTQTTFRLLGVSPAVRDYFGQMKYKPKPRFRSGLLLADGRPGRLTSVGRLLPQPRLDGVLLDDLLGDGFSLIGFGMTAEVVQWISRLPSLAGLNPACFLVPAADHRDIKAVQEVKALNDATGVLAAGLDRPIGRIFLVRPDRYVFGAFEVNEAPEFDRRLGAILRGARRGARAEKKMAAVA